MMIFFEVSNFGYGYGGRRLLLLIYDVCKVEPWSVQERECLIGEDEWSFIVFTMRDVRGRSPLRRQHC